MGGHQDRRRMAVRRNGVDQSRVRIPIRMRRAELRPSRAPFQEYLQA